MGGGWGLRRGFATGGVGPVGSRSFESEYGGYGFRLCLPINCACLPFTPSDRG